MAQRCVDFAIRRVPLADAWAGGLAGDVLAGRGEALDLYAWPPGREALPEAIAARRGQAERAPAGELAAVLRAGHERRGDLTPAVAESLERLAQPDTVVVVTGQQPGLFGGPLYAFYKAVTAIQEAARLQRDGVPAVPVFWVATEDDDYAETAHVWVVDAADRPRRLRLQVDHAEGQSVGRLPVDSAALAPLLAELSEALPDTAFTPEVVAALRECYADATIGDAFARWLSRLLGDHGLVILDPMDAGVRRLALPLMEQVLAEPLAPTRLGNEVGERIEALGHKAPTHRHADLCAFYLCDGGVRRRLRFDGDGTFVTDAGREMSTAELRDALAEQPRRMSWSVLLRPVVQDYLLPTAAMVVGPGELAYAAQVGPVYDHLGVARPVLLPRRSATLVDPRAQRALSAYDLRATELWQEDEAALLSRVSRERFGADTAALFSDTLLAIEPLVGRLVAHAAKIDPTLRASGEGVMNRLRGQAGKLESKVQRALKRQNEDLVRRVALAYAHLQPGGAMQERRLGLLNYLGAFGFGCLPPLIAALDALAPDEHGLLEILP